MQTIIRSISKRNRRAWFCGALLALLVGASLTGSAWAQGVTTAAFNGMVVDQEGKPLQGANVVAVHVPTGTFYGAATREDGRFNIPSVRVGGPYNITVTFIGYTKQELKDISLGLGEDRRLVFKLAEEALQAAEVTVTAEQNEVLSASRTGAVTSIDATELRELPTLNRSISDFARLTPQAGGGFNSFAGRNNLYNNISIDGSVFNNVFGLASEVGGQTNAQPISLDAVEEMRVSIAPYDVRQGSFTGADISVITKAGTNQFKASAYTFLRDEGLVSDRVSNADVANTDFSQKRYGLRLAGPVIRDKAFLFANAELGRRNDPGSTFRAAQSTSEVGQPGVSSVLASDLDRLKAFTQGEFSLDPGVYQSYDLDTYSDNITARFDLNVNPTNRFTVRYNYLKSYRDTPISNSGASGGRQPSAQRLPFSGSNYLINNNVHSIIGQLNSTFGNKYSNEFVVGYTSLRDFREGKSNPFPTVDLENGAGSTITTIGYEPFTANNKLDSDIFQISDNFTAYYGKHTLTFGTAHEIYSFSNGFTPDYYSRYRFRTIDEFMNHVNGTPSIDTNGDGVPDAVPQPTVFSIQYSAVAGVDVPLAEIGAWQASLYAQDEFLATPSLKLNIGLRVDVPIYTKDLPANPTIAALTFSNGEKIDVSKLPDASPLWSPRLGFNWDVQGDRTLQVRGGIGVFTGKIPFVWLSNQASNNGILFGSTSLTGNGITPLRDPATNQNVVFNPERTAYVPANPTVPATVLINATANDFKFPQVWRNNLAVDKQLPWDLLGTLEGIYSRDLNAVFHRNTNFEPAVGNFSGADNRPRYARSTAGTRINDNVTNAIILDNTSEGYQYSITGELRKQYPQGAASLAYTYAVAKDLTSSVSAIAATAWSTNQVVNSPNDPVLAFARNDQRHRVVGTGSYRLNLFGLSGTTLSTIYVGGPQVIFLNNVEGNYQYTYAGDMNGDLISGNDLMYIPRNANDPNEIMIDDIRNSAGVVTRSAAVQRQELEAYLSQDPYLSKHRGEYAERGGAKGEWVHRLDLGLKQEFYLGSGNNRNALEVSFDLVNFLNLIDSDWGVVKAPITTSPVAFARYDAATNQPVFTFPLVGGAPLTKTFQSDPNENSRWRALFGLRYSFN